MGKNARESRRYGKQPKNKPVTKPHVKLCGISCKVFISVPTRVKQNHPRGTHKKTDLKKWLPVDTGQKEKKKSERKHQDSPESYDGNMGPTTTHNKQYTKGPGKPNAIWFILGKSWT